MCSDFKGRRVVVIYCALPADPDSRRGFTDCKSWMVEVFVNGGFLIVRSLQN
jgi:hypothetical protein